MSNLIQFPPTREHVKRKVMISVDKLLSGLGNTVGYLRMLDESDADFRKRVLDKINGSNR